MLERSLNIIQNLVSLVATMGELALGSIYAFMGCTAMTRQFAYAAVKPESWLIPSDPDAFVILRPPIA